MTWYTSDNDTVAIIRVSANDERLSEEAEKYCLFGDPGLLVRTQDKFRDNYVPDNETFVRYRECDKSQYCNAFVKQGHYRFTSLERQRLVYNIMTSPNKMN